MRITYLGHSCFYIDWNGQRIVTDPYNKGMFGEGVMPRKMWRLTLLR